MSSIKESPAKAEARGLLDRLRERGISLRLEGTRIRWSTDRQSGLSITDIRSIKRLDAELKALMAHSDLVTSTFDSYMPDRNGGAA